MSRSHSPSDFYYDFPLQLRDSKGGIVYVDDAFCAADYLGLRPETVARAVGRGTVYGGIAVNLDPRVLQLAGLGWSVDEGLRFLTAD